MGIARTGNIHPKRGDTPVTLKIAGNVLELRYSCAAGGSPIRKVNADLGVDLRTGEAIEFRHCADRAGDKASVAQSLKRLRDLINANLETPENALWVTLTYAENMKDTKRLYEDFRRFWQRFRYRYSSAQYIIAAEPQGRGAWHLHCLFLFPRKAPFIPNQEIAGLWRHGFCKTKRLQGIDNPGLYLTAYLGDMELGEAVSAGVKKGMLKETRNGKAVIKGARLALYPSGFHLYRTSRGIKRPIILHTTEQEAQEIVGTTPLTYEKTIVVSDESGRTVNVINYRTYTRPPKSSPMK